MTVKTRYKTPRPSHSHGTHGASVPYSPAGLAGGCACAFVTTATVRRRGQPEKTIIDRNLQTPLTLWAGTRVAAQGRVEEAFPITALTRACSIPTAPSPRDQHRRRSAWGGKVVRPHGALQDSRQYRFVSR